MTEKEVQDGFIEVEAWVAIDSEELVWAHEDLDCLKDRLDEDGASVIRRIVKVTIKLPAPSYAEALAVLPPESDKASVTVS